MKDDLARNALLGEENVGKARKVVEQVVNGHVRIQRLAMYWAVLKGVLALLLLISFIYVGYSFITNIKTMATEAVVDEAKEMASEKYTAVKEKAKEATKNQGLFGAISSVAAGVNSKLDSMVSERLIAQGYDPTAPRYCAVNPTAIQMETCIQYTDTELSMNEYEWLRTAWKGTCEEVQESSISLLTLAGKITYNDKRALIEQCEEIKAQQTTEELEEMKQRMITGEPNVQGK